MLTDLCFAMRAANSRQTSTQSTQVPCFAQVRALPLLRSSFHLIGVELDHNFSALGSPKFNGVCYCYTRFCLYRSTVETSREVPKNPRIWTLWNWTTGCMPQEGSVWGGKLETCGTLQHGEKSNQMRETGRKVVSFWSFHPFVHPNIDCRSSRASACPCNRREWMCCCCFSSRIILETSRCCRTQQDLW